MINKDIDQITEQDLQELIDEGTIEIKTLEYKVELPGGTDSEKKEFLADVSSFANASGGDIIYGIISDKSTGKPLELKGLSITNADNEILRLENIIRDSIEPRIPSINIKSIQLTNSQYVIIIRIPRSWNKPHRIKFQDYHKFYSRASNGKYLLDVGELRTIFNLSDTLAEKIRRFREDRISSIIADQTFIPLGENPKIVLHLIPLISFELGQRHVVSTVGREPGDMFPIGVNGYDTRYNLDGYLTFINSSEDARLGAYTQFYRNGIIESVNGLMIPHRGKGMRIPSLRYEMSLIKSLRGYLSLMKGSFIEPPILLFLSLLDVIGYTLEIPPLISSGGYPIDRDNLLLPEVAIENYDEPAKKILKPCFDSIWNACGLERDFNYDENGNWKG